MASLGQKIIGASAGAALLCAATAGTGLWVAFSLSGAQSHATTSAKILRVHMHADMMHDALRGDVSGAIMSADPALGVDLKAVRADLAEHVQAFKDDIKANNAMATDPAIKAALAELDAPLAAYIASASNLIAAADANPADARAQLPSFNTQFSTLEGGMSQATDKIEAAATRDAKAAEQASLVGQGVMAVLLAMAGALAVVLIVAAKRGLVAPLVEVTRALRRLAEGDLDAL